MFPKLKRLLNFSVTAPETHVLVVNFVVLDGVPQDLRGVEVCFVLTHGDTGALLKVGHPLRNWALKGVHMIRRLRFDIDVCSIELLRAPTFTRGRRGTRRGSRPP